MGLAHSSSIVTDGLTCYYDFSNRKKSFINQIVTNQFLTPTPAGNGDVVFAINGTGIFKRITTGNYAGYEILPTDIVYRYDLGLAPTGCHYHGNTINITAGQRPTWGFDYYIDPSTTGYPVTNYLANMESSIGVGAAITDPTPSITGVWKRGVQTSAPASTTGTFNAYLYPGACGTQLATGGFILYKNPQVTLTPYDVAEIGTAQSITAATGLKDLTNNRTTSTLNISYPTGVTPATYTFLNSINSGVSTDSSAILNNDIHSIFFMIRFNTTSTYGSNGYSGSWDMIFQYAAGGSDRTPGVWRYPGQRYLHWRYDPSNTGCDFGKNSSNQDFDIDTWYYVGVTKNGSSTVQYVNGAQVGTGTVSSPKTAGNAAVTLFPYYPQDLASMGLCQIYNRALSAAEVQQNFNALRGRVGI